MVFGFVAFTKIKLHPLSSIIRSAIDQAMTQLIFVGKVGKLGGDMWLWGADQLVSHVFHNKKLVQQHFILLVTTLETRHNHYWQRTWFHWQMTHVEFASNTIFDIMGKYHDFGKIQFRWGRAKMYPLGTFVKLKCTHWVHFSSTPPKLSSNWETENLPIYRIWCLVMSSTYKTLNDGRVPRVTLDWKVDYLWFKNLDQHLPSTPISTVWNSLVMIHYW